jgi:hypothetical protein
MDQAKTPPRRCQRRASPGQPRLPQRRTHLRPATPHGYRPPARERPLSAVRWQPRLPPAEPAARRPPRPQPPRHHRRARHPVRQGTPQLGHLRLPYRARTARGRRWRPPRAQWHLVPQAIRRRARYRPVTRRKRPPIPPGGSCPPPPDHARFRLGPRLMRWQRPSRCRRSRPLTGPRHRAPVQQPTCPRTHRRTPAGSSLRCRARCPMSSLPPAACGCCRPRAVARVHRRVRHPAPSSVRQHPARRHHRHRAGPRPVPKSSPLLRPPILPRLPQPQPQPPRRAQRAAQPRRRHRPLLRP